ncbi:MAG: hypothetical protein GTN64_02410 [Candidatus Latescibacteria bacterium]|nr:hypothetical protein [Candidatus Latescibacterota bacterium]NIO77470.1 hypothetical protein [Candidatus Latescibacterota bacterium]
MDEYHEIGEGRLQLRQHGKHLILTHGRKATASKFKADKFVDKKVLVYVKVVDAEKIKRRKSSPRI